MNIPCDIRELLSCLDRAGIRGYIVGGAVRDFLLSREPVDYDIAAECFPEELCRAFEGYQYYDTGLRFGTLNVFSGERFVEITCCRRESGYTDLRRPDTVEFTRNIREDLARRDLTINAMAISAEGKLIDPYGGAGDLESATIRTVGDAGRRFSEDALRIIRALRFSSCLGFEIEAETARAIHEHRHLLKKVAGERIFEELKKLLMGDDVVSTLLEYSDVLCTVIPEMEPCVGLEQHNSYHIYTVYEHILRSVDAAPKDETVRLAMLLHDIGKPAKFFWGDDGRGHFHGHPELSEKMAEDILRRLHADGECIRRVAFLVKHHDVRPKATRKSIHKYLCRVGFEGARLLLQVRRADSLAQSPEFFYQLSDLDKTAEIIDMLEKEGACICVSDLAVGGRDIIALGAAPGPLIGEVLSSLLLQVASGGVKNEREPLLRLAKGLLKQANE